MAYTFYYHQGGEQRDGFIRTIAEILGEQVTEITDSTYELGFINVTVDGDIEVVGDEDDEMENLLDKLAEHGYHHDPIDLDLTEESVLEPDVSNQPTVCTIKLPLGYLGANGLENLRRLVRAKKTLICKALDITDAPIVVEDEIVALPWEVTLAPDEVGAYCLFIEQLLKTAKEKKRVTAKEKPVDNERFAMRIFLISLGMNGDTFKAARNLMMHRLSGDAAWAKGRPE